MAISRHLLALVFLAVLGSGRSVQAADGWFGGLKIAPWVNRADALLNVENADGSPRRRGLRPAQGHPLELELSYAGSGADNPASLANAGRTSNTPRNFRLTGIGTLNLGDRVGLTGRLGAARGDMDASNLYGNKASDSSLRPTFGLGLRYDLTPDLRLQGGWDRYHLGAPLRAGDDGVDLLTIGLKYHF